MRFAPQLALIVAVAFLGIMPQTAHAKTKKKNKAATTAVEKPLAEADLKDAKGADVGTATFFQSPHGVKMVVKVAGLPPGAHGLHFHENGKCDAPDFKTAGGHLNPDKKQHGLHNPNGPHAGDLPNLIVSAGGTGVGQFTTDRVTLSEGPNSLLKDGGVAVVIHATIDDQKSDPAGNAGARIACGVITKAQDQPQTAAPAAQ